jgi:D-alanyl-D-alanine carboxypeptidase
MPKAHALPVALIVAALAASSCATPGTASIPPTAGPTDAVAATAPSPSPTLAPAFDLLALLDARREAYGAPGALVVLRRADGQWAATSGAADLAGTPLDDVSRFRIASITKPIVAALVLDALERGLVSLDDVVGELLPGTLRPEPPVTVRQLLDHTSGIFDESNDGDPEVDIERLAEPLRTEATELMRRWESGERVIASDRLIVALSETHDRYNLPGLGYHYSNTNYQLAAMVLEAVTGQTLADLLAERIVAPLGLERTTIAPPDTTSPELRGYGIDPTDGSFVDMTDELVAFGNGGNGGIISTPDELLTIMQAIVDGRLLPPALVTEMETPHLQSYGLGLAKYQLSCGSFFGHGGLVNGTASIAIVSQGGAEGVAAAFNLQSDTDAQLPAFADTILCRK